MIRILDIVGGEDLATHELEHPAVWDGMVAANGRLFLADESGAILSLGN
jgi:hypothetical protein